MKYFCACFLVAMSTAFGLPDGSNIRQLVQNFPENQELIGSLGIKYEIVYPVQYREDWVRGLSTREVSSGNKVSHLSRTYILIETVEHKFHLDLELNVNLLAPTLVQTQYTATSQKIIDTEIENCYYHATVRNYSGSYAALRTCYGLNGIIYFEKGLYLIHPLYGDDSINHPHLLYDYFEEVDEKFSCGNTEEDETLHCLQEQLRQSVAKGELMSNKYIELGLLLDKNFFEKYDASGKDAVSEAIHIVNCADLLYRSVNTSLSVVYLELWEENQINLTSNITVSLDTLRHHVANKLTRLSVDAAQLLSGFEFDNEETGIGVTDSICTVNALGITKVSNIFKPHLTSLSVAHVLGHNLGMYHDNKCCQCPSEKDCLLSKTVKSLHTFFFSSCSIEDYYKSLNKGYGKCLFNMPRLRESVCGNGILEKDEECDCGTLEACLQYGSCCDPVTCKYVKHAECSSGPCCKKCKLMSTDHMCRSSKGECDIPEFCDGIKGECPEDLYKKNGLVCNGGLGYCYSGDCPSLQQQCSRLWGQGSDGAHSVCYERLNVRGTPNGNCGPDGVGGLLKCSKENSYCGTLQCHHGRKAPITNQKPLKYFVDKITENGEVYECKVFPGMLDSHDTNYGLVEEGTKCGYQKFCVNKTCIRVKNAVSANCPVSGLDRQICSGHGVCTNINTCFCDEGWVYKDCSEFEGITEEKDELKEVMQYPVLSADSIEDKEEAGTLKKGYKETLVITIVVTSVLIGLALVGSLFFIFLKR